MKRNKTIVIHLVVWVFLILIVFCYLWLGGIFTWGSEENMNFQEAISTYANMVVLPMILYSIIFYLFYFLTPRIFSRGNYSFKFGAIVFIFLLALGVFIIGKGVFENSGAFADAIRGFSIFLFIGVLGVMFRFAIDWVNLKTKSDELQKQNLSSELQLLKNQISPHFFFNTLNNIDSLIKSNAEKASETLVKLSEIMRYMIYDTKVNRVSLSCEIKHIENYIELQAIQYANKNLVSFNVKGAPDSISIAPVMFISFVENAFKHCTNKEINEAIQIQFSIEGDVVTFESRNLADKTKKITKDESSGVGLDIIRRRLELIYPEKHKLEIEEEDDSFKVFLRINTNEN